jgi:hypothetical protein
LTCLAAVEQMADEFALGELVVELIPFFDLSRPARPRFPDPAREL